MDGLREQERIWPPPISFKAKSKRTQKKSAKSSTSSDDDDSDDEKYYRSFEARLNPDYEQETDTYKVKVQVFEDGTAEDWISWRIAVEDLFNKLQAENNSSKQHQIYSSLLSGKAKERYVGCYNSRNATNSALPNRDRYSDEEVLNLVVNDTAKKYFSTQCDWSNAYRYQKAYMRKNLFIGDMDPDVFCDRLEKMNGMLPYFPVFDDANDPAKLDDDELCDILDSAKKPEWHITMMSQGMRPHSFESFENAKTYYKQLWNAEQFAEKMTPKWEKNARDNPKRSVKRHRRDHSDEEDGSGSTEKPKCAHCGKIHKSDNCWSLSKNKNKRPKSWNKNEKRADDRSKDTFTTDEVSAMINFVAKRFTKKKKANNKREKRATPDEESDGELDSNMISKLQEEFKRDHHDDSDDDIIKYM